MTTQAIQNDEDLIILGDSTSNADTSLIDFNFDVKPEFNTQAVTDFSKNDEISSDVSFDFNFATDDKVAQDTNISLGDEMSLETSTPEVDNIFDFSSEVTSQDIQDTVSDMLVEDKVSDTAFDFGVVAENEIVKNDFTENEEVSFSRNDILEEAISKMQSRKGAISQTKQTKQTKVDELNKQIDLLKKEVELFQGEIKDLEKEDSALDLDIGAIEKMKNMSIDVNVDRPRKHNLDTIKKTK